MASLNQVQSIANRLGFQEEPDVIKKAEELIRVLSTKVTTIKLTASALAVLCLDIASSLLGIIIDKETAVKLSGLKNEKAYQKSLNTLEKILQLDQPLTIKDVCVQLSCTVVKDLGEKILQSYREQSVIGDLNHSQYAAVVVYTACNLKNIKVDKTKLIALSRLKPAQFKELSIEFAKFAEKRGFKINHKSKKSTKNGLHEFLEERVHNSADNNAKSPQKGLKNVHNETEDYDVWKARILKAAKEALLKARHIR